MPDPHQEPVESFRPTSGRVVGSLVLAMVVGVVLIAVLDPGNALPAPVVAGSLLVGVLAWGSMLRPRVWATKDSLVLRNMFSTVTIPLAAVEEVAVQQVLAVRAGEKRYVSPAVGRTRRQASRARRERSAGTPAHGNLATMAYADFVEERIRRLVADALAARGVRRYSDEQAALAGDVRRDPAYLELGLLAAAVVGLVGTLLVR